MQAVEVGDVECIQHATPQGSEGELLFVGPRGEANIQRGDDRDLSGAKSGDQIAIHRVFIDVDLDPAHWRGLPPVLLFERLGLLGLGVDVGVDFGAVGVVIRQRRVDLRQR